MINESLRNLLISLKDNEAELRNDILKDESLYDGYNNTLESLHLQNAEKLSKIVKIIMSTNAKKSLGPSK